MKQPNPQEYIRTRARKLPIDACYINEGWKKSGLASILIVRKHTNNNYTFGVYLVDIFALGTKDTFFNFNVSKSVVSELLERMQDDKFIKTEYSLIHNIIYGGNEFAEDNGYKVCKDFKLTQFILEEDTEDVEFIDIEFGKNGKPFLIV